jgi:chaperone required for assembly of F1-ATPase
MTLKNPSTFPVREAPRPKTKRVYKSVSVAAVGGRYRVLLDGRPVMTPMRMHVDMPGRTLAEAVAAEWDAQDPFIDPEAMPLTRLISTALDRVSADREGHINELMKYVDADLLCYRAAYPAVLKARQEKVWQPVLDWAATAHGIALTVSEGLMPSRQPDAAAVALRSALSALDNDRLTALQACAAITSSLALALALTHGRVSATEAFAAAVLDETYQMEQWGEDELALDRRQRIEADLLAIGEYLRLLKEA